MSKVGGKKSSVNIYLEVISFPWASRSFERWHVYWKLEFEQFLILTPLKWTTYAAFLELNCSKDRSIALPVFYYLNHIDNWLKKSKIERKWLKITHFLKWSWKLLDSSRTFSITCNKRHIEKSRLWFIQEQQENIRFEPINFQKK
jgi:hypothetical protein